MQGSSLFLAEGIGKSTSISSSQKQSTYYCFNWHFLLSMRLIAISYIHRTCAFPLLELPASSHTPFAYFPIQWITFFFMICQSSLYSLNNIPLSVYIYCTYFPTLLLLFTSVMLYSHSEAFKF